MWKFRFARDAYLNLTTQTLVDASHPACFECVEATLLNIARWAVILSLCRKIAHLRGPMD